MAAAGNNAFRQVGGALGPAVLGALLTSRAVSSLPGRLSDAGVDGPLADRLADATREGGLGAIGSVPFGAQAGRIQQAVGEAFLEGMRLCLTVSAGLTFLAAVLAFVLLRPRRTATGTEKVVRTSTAQTAQTSGRAKSLVEEGA